MKKKIVITGANGQVGQSLHSISRLYPEFDFYFLDKKACNIVSRRSVAQSFGTIDPDYIINTAAYTAVDMAEKEKDKAMAINAYALRNISGEIGKAKCIHLSSDYVYKDSVKGSVKESMPTSPKNIYAKSKLLGEEVLKSSRVPAMIIRTSWVYSQYGKNFVKVMLNQSKTKHKLSVVNDQLGSPTYAIDLATAILDIIRNDAANLILSKSWNSIYNYCNSGQVSWYEFALSIFEIAKINIEIKPIPTILYPTPAIRPRWSVLDTSKIQSSLNINIFDWKVSLEKCIRHLVN